MQSELEKLFSVSERNIIIAGGAGQIGYAIARGLAALNANVLIADVDEELALGKLEADGCLSDVEVVPLDVSNVGSIAKLKSHLGGKKLHGLVNCFHFKGNTRKLDTASNFFSDFEQYPLEAWDNVHDVNLKGTFALSQALLPSLRAAQGAAVVNFSSTYGNVSANPNIYGDSGINSPVAYATSKGGIIQLTRYMAVHLAKHKIRVNCLSPGGVLNNQTEEFISNYSNLTPLSRMSQASEYVAAVVFMLGPGASYMTGSNMIVDGGWTAW